MDGRDFTIAIIKRFSGNANNVTIPRLFIDLLDGDMCAAALLNQILYWTERTDSKDGWFFKSYADWKTELGISQYQVTRAINGDKRAKKTERMTLAKLGVTTKLKKAKGAPTVHYRIDMDVFLEALMQQISVSASPLAIPIINNVDNPLSTMSIIHSEQTQQSYTEITTERREEGEAAPEMPKADEVQPELELPQLGARPAHMLNFEAHHGMDNPYIQAFTDVYGDTTLIKDRRARITADALEQAGATPDDVRRIASAKAKAGKKEYRFAYVLQDFAGEKAVAKAQSSPPEALINPDDVIRMGASTYVTSNYRKSAVLSDSDDKAVDDVA